MITPGAHQLQITDLGRGFCYISAIAEASIIPQARLRWHIQSLVATYNGQRTSYVAQRKYFVARRPSHDAQRRSYVAERRSYVAERSPVAIPSLGAEGKAASHANALTRRRLARTVVQLVVLRHQAVAERNRNLLVRRGVGAQSRCPQRIAAAGALATRLECSRGLRSDGGL